MITLGTVGWGSSPTINITLEYEHQRNGADMQYRVRTTIEPVTGERYFGYPIYLQLTLDGSQVLTQTLKGITPSQWSSPRVFTSEWFTIANKTSGTATASFRIYSGSGSSRNTTYSFALAVDPAGSTISASDGTLGVAQTITLTRYAASFTDSILWECGSSSGTIATKSSATSFTWTPAVSLAAENINADAVLVTLICQTYEGDTLIQTRTFTVSEAIPASVKPSVSVSVSDHNGHAATYGAYIQGQSALDIVVTPTPAYGSPIASYAITADGKAYSATPTTTPALSGSGTLPVVARATDQRGRTSDPATQNITVLPWVAPVISAVTCERCLADGTPNSEGAYMKITFDASVSDLNNQNSAAYVLQYKRSDAQSWTNQTLTAYAGQYTVTGGSVVVPADVSYSFDAQIVATDDFVSVTAQTTGVGIAFDLIDFRATGKGITFGRVATEDDFVCALDTTFEGNVNIEQNTQIDGDLNVDGNVTIGGALTLSAPLSVAQGGTGANNVPDALLNLGLSVETLTITATKTSGSCTIQGCKAYRQGKVVTLEIGIRTSASISAGSVILEATIDEHLPLCYMSTVSFASSYVSAILVRPDGRITIREIVGTVPTNYNIFYSLTYVEA